MLVPSGNRVEVGGWYVDTHHHPIFLRVGDVAPVCPRVGPALVTWRLVVPLVLPASRR